MHSCFLPKAPEKEAECHIPSHGTSSDVCSSLLIFDQSIDQPTNETTKKQTNKQPDRETMLNRALEALGEVLEARFEPSRLTKERAAVLSEMSMVNTIEYRVECAILQVSQ